jgi:hypothetical protein
VPSSESLTPAHQRASVRTNSLYNDDTAAMTPGVQSAAYTGKLTPQMTAELHHQQAEHPTPTADAVMAAAGASAENGVAGQGGSFRQGRYATGKATSNGSSFSFVPDMQPKLNKPELATTGDLYNPPDQDSKV